MENNRKTSLEPQPVITMSGLGYSATTSSGPRRGRPEVLYSRRLPRIAMAEAGATGAASISHQTPLATIPSTAKGSFPLHKTLQ